MHRKDFIKSCGMGCMAVLGASALLQSCAHTKYLNAAIEGSDMLVPLKDFAITAKGTTQYRKYVVVQNDRLQFPICVYRISENEYHALWMKCTHQGAELQVFGDRLQCPAHGSEFTHNGMVQNGPAATHLRTFPVTVSDNYLKIDLR